MKREFEKLFEKRIQKLKSLEPDSVKEADGGWYIYNEELGWERVTIDDINYIEACIINV